MNFSFRSSRSTAVGVLEIGMAHLTAARVQPGGAAAKELVASASFERIWSWVEGELSSALDDALGELRAAWGAGGPVHLVVPSHLVLTKVLQVPATAAAQRERIIAFEARQAIPFPLEEVVWDTRVLDDAGTTLNVLLAAAKLDAVMALVARVRAQGFEPLSVMPACVALAAAWERGGEPHAPVLLLGLGARSSQLLFGAPRMWQLRTLAVGGSQVSRSIADQLEQPPPEADRLKLQVLRRQVELPPDSRAGAAVSEAIAGYRRRLGAEVQRSLAVMQRQEPRQEPASIQLTGEAAAAPELETVLAQRFGKPVEWWEPPTNDPVLRRRAEWWGGAWAAVTGAPWLNLLPASLAAAQQARQRRPRWLGAAALFVAALALPGLHWQRLAAARSAATQDLNRRIAPHQVLRAQIQDDVTAVEALREQVRELHDLRRAQGAWPGFLADLQTRLLAVDDAWLERLQVLPAAKDAGAGSDAADLRLRLSGRLLDRENPLSRVSPSSYEHATALLQGLVESPYVLGLEGERFDASDPGILRFDFTLVLNSSRVL